MPQGDATIDMGSQKFNLLVPPKAKWELVSLTETWDSFQFMVKGKEDFFLLLSFAVRKGIVYVTPETNRVSVYVDGVQVESEQVMQAGSRIDLNSILSGVIRITSPAKPA